MPRGKRKDTRTAQEKMNDLVIEIEKQEAVLKDLKQQKAALEKAIEDEQKEELFQKVKASGRTIEEILKILK